MAIAWWYVIYPDLEYAATFPNDDEVYWGEGCYQFSEEVIVLLWWLLGNHIVCAISCFFNEIYETAVGWKGQFISISHIFTLMLSSLIMFDVICVLFRFYGY